MIKRLGKWALISTYIVNHLSIDVTYLLLHNNVSLIHGDFFLFHLSSRRKVKV